MKWIEIKKIVETVAFDKEEDAGYSGARSDFGAGAIRSRVKNFEDKLILKLDLRPSEVAAVNEFEVGYPGEFSSEIKVALGLIKYNELKGKFSYPFD